MISNGKGLERPCNDNYRSHQPLSGSQIPSQERTCTKMREGKRDDEEEEDEEGIVGKDSSNKSRLTMKKKQV